MVWFRVDDKLHDHRKARRAEVAAMGLWALAGSWSADNLTDGFVPASIAVRWTPDHSLASRLVVAELWTPDSADGEDGWRFHEWGLHQPTRDKVLAERAAAAERKRRWLQERRENGEGAA